MCFDQHGASQVCKHAEPKTKKGSGLPTSEQTSGRVVVFGRQQWNIKSTGTEAFAKECSLWICRIWEYKRGSAIQEGTPPSGESLRSNFGMFGPGPCFPHVRSLVGRWVKPAEQNTY